MQQQKEYLRIRIKVSQYKLPVGLIVDCFNITWLDDPLVNQADCLLKLARGHCCTNFDALFQKKLATFEGEVVAIKD